MSSSLKPVSWIQSFVEFLREQGVVGLSIGFMLGGAITGLVSAFVADLVQPFLSLFVGSVSGFEMFVVGPFKVGHFVLKLLDFLLIAATVFFVFRGLKLDRLDRSKTS